ncbi:homeobox protein 5-like isoform X2 [Panonychus citri]|uniref:homeobox protein 5-like isoform X2 n=1 Tax=Panonychus citri TaxID=50023 RepID=UPI002307C4F2|nr:homeobox protein 5-like isoform X2 [Panonychus citri]
MPVSTSHYQSYDQTINGLSTINGSTSNGVVIVSPNNQTTSLQSTGINNNNNCSNGANSVNNNNNNNNNKDKYHHQQQHHHKHQQLTVRPTSPLIDQPHLNGTLSQLTSPNSSSSRPPIMNGGLINGSGGGNGTINRNQSKNRLTVNHISSPSLVGLGGSGNGGGGSGNGGGGLLSTTTSPNGNTFNSTKQTLLDITRSGIGGGLTPPGLVTSSSSTTVQPTPGSRLPPLRNGAFNISRISGPPFSPTRMNQQSASDIIFNSNGISEMLSSLALMCLLSLLMAFLALFFLQRTGPIITIPEDLKPNEIPISPSTGPPPIKDKTTVNVFSQSRIVVNTREYVRVFQISVSLSTLTISLNLCCLFVCCIQFLSAVKLLKAPQGTKRTLQFLKKTSHVRITAIGAFLLSIPIFFTGVILFTFINFDETPALITSVIIGIGIVFCGLASVQNVYLWLRKLEHPRNCQRPD